MTPRGPLLDVRWIDDFLALVACRSFTRAARQRNVSQSGFSRRIQALEQWAGAPLVDRLSQPLGLTWTGHCFKGYAEHLSASLSTMKQMVAVDPDDPVICVHAIVSDGLRRVADAMLEGPLKKQVPLARLLSRFEPYPVARTGLADGTVQLWLAAQDPTLPIDLDPQKFEAKVVLHDRLLTVVAAMGDLPLYSWPGSRRARAPIIDYLPTHPVASLESLRRARNLGEAYVRAGCTTDTMEGARMLVEGGRGIGILLESLVREKLDSGLLTCARADWARPIDVLLVRSRQAGVSFTGPAVDAAARLWAAAPTLQPRTKPPSPDADERGGLMVSDVVRTDHFLRGPAVGPMPQGMRDAHAVRMSR